LLLLLLCQSTSWSQTASASVSPYEAWLLPSNKAASLTVQKTASSGNYSLSVVCLAVHLSVCLSICLSATIDYLFICVCVWVCVCVCICVCVCACVRVCVFRSIQCGTGGQPCWCVDSKGQEIVGTRTSDSLPNCKTLRLFCSLTNLPSAQFST